MNLHVVLCVLTDHRWVKVREWGPSLAMDLATKQFLGHRYRWSRRQRFLMSCRCGCKQVWKAEKYLEWAGKRNVVPLGLIKQTLQAVMQDDNILHGRRKEA